MRLSALLPLLPAAVAVPASERAQPAPLIIPWEKSVVIQGKYMVVLRDDTASSSLNDIMGLFPGNATQVYKSLFKGFTAEFDEASLRVLRNHPDVDFVEPDQMVPTSVVDPKSYAPSEFAPTLQLGSEIEEYMSKPNAGQGVCAYVLDTGLDASHADFGGRAIMVASTVDREGYDHVGHGTHVAGIIGSNTYGVAKKVNIYGIKVLSDPPRNSSFSTIIAGMDYVDRDVALRNCPNGVVVNMSLGGPYTAVGNLAARRLIEKGYFVAVAAGNDGIDARNVSPASEKSVCTVGGAGYEDSNWGTIVDIQAPAVDVPSTFPGNQFRYMTGTSMASPFIAGLAAAIASTPGQHASPHLCEAMVHMMTKKGYQYETS